MSVKKNICVFLLLILPLQAFSIESKIPGKREFIAQVLKQLDTDSGSQQLASKSLANKGIQEPRIYQKIIGIIDAYASQPENKAQYKSISWLVKGLANSGDEQYRAYIENLSNTAKRRVKTHAKKALKILDKAKILNPVVNNEEAYDSSIDNWDSIRTINILNSDLAPKYKLNARDTITANKNYSIRSEQLITDHLKNSNKEKVRNSRELKAHSKAIKWLALFPTELSFNTLRSVAASSKTEKLKSRAKKQYARVKKVRGDYSKFKQESLYEGEKIGVVNFSINEKILNNPKKLNLLQEQNVKKRIITRLNLFDENSTNSVNIAVKFFRVRSKAAKLLVGNLVTGPDVFAADVSLNLSNKEQNATVDIHSAKLLSNQYTEGDPGLAENFLEKVYGLLVFLQ